MSASTLAEPRPLMADDKMHQVRDLLIGDYVRANEQRMAAIEGRIAALETSVAERLAAVQQQIEKLGGDTSADRRAAFEELARGITDLGERIKVVAR
jgi:hypothetical protein